MTCFDNDLLVTNEGGKHARNTSHEQDMDKASHIG